jgi:hypothetical protein
MIMDDAMRQRVLLLLLVAVVVAGCSATPEPSAFYDYASAITYYTNRHDAEKMIPYSTAIARVLYYPKTPRRVFIVYFTSSPERGYIHEGLEQATWEAWKAADSKGRFYDQVIKDRYAFRFGAP